MNKIKLKLCIYIIILAASPFSLLNAGYYSYNLPLETMFVSREGRSDVKLTKKNGNPLLTFKFKPDRKAWGYICVLIPKGQITQKHKGIKITCKASLPVGLKLAAVLDQDSSAYSAVLPDGAPDRWSEITVSFKDFKFADWSIKKDPNKKLDPEDVQAILIGFKGELPESTEDATGWIELKKIEFIDKL